MNYQQQILTKRIPYSEEEIFKQICLYKIFEVNLKRAILMNDKSYINKVSLINSEWFEKWKKLSYYEAIKDELNMNQTIQENYNNSIKNYYTIIQNFDFQENLPPEINNNSVYSGYNNNTGKIEIDPYFNFELISPELWNSFVPPNSINNGTGIELDIEYLTKDSLVVDLSSKSCYIFFWKMHEQKLGKIILIFQDEFNKYQTIEHLKSIGINNFYACYLGELKDELEVKENNFSFKCINRAEYSSKNSGKKEEENNLPPVGLENIGATCYMNSALQCLVNTPKLTKYFLDEENAIQKNGNALLSNNFLEIVKNLLRKEESSKHITTFSPNVFFNVVQSDPLFQGLAGDSIDLIRFFLQTIHSELNHLRVDNCFSKYKTNNNIILNNFLDSFTQNNQSIITDTFFFIEKSELYCEYCHHTATSYGCFSDLIFPLEEIRKFIYGNNSNCVSLMDGFEFFKRKSYISGQNQISCNNCHYMSNAYQNNSLYNLPEVLIINLNRGKGNIYNVGINYNEIIDLSGEVETHIESSDTFKLICIISHFGPSSTSGHFIAFCYVERKGKWYEFNDSIVTESSFEEAKNKGVAYVLFYQRQ